MQQDKTKKKTYSARSRVGQLTCPVAGRGRTDVVRGASFSGSKPRSESGTWRHKLPLHSFKFSHGASRTVILVGHHWKARHRAADESARRDSNRSMEGGTGKGAAFRYSREIYKVRRRPLYRCYKCSLLHNFIS